MTSNQTPEEITPQEVQIFGTNCGIGVCLECIGLYKMHMDNPENVANNVPPPPLQWGITLAPNWQQNNIRTPQGFQTVVQCVPVPCCPNHLGVKAITPEQRAAQSGLIIPGM